MKWNLVGYEGWKRGTMKHTKCHSRLKDIGKNCVSIYSMHLYQKPSVRLFR